MSVMRGHQALAPQLRDAGLLNSLCTFVAGSTPMTSDDVDATVDGVRFLLSRLAQDRGSPALS